MQNTILSLALGNILYLISYSVHDILWLRILNVAAAIFLVPFYALQPKPLEAPIVWNAVFVAINAFWIVRLLIERRPVHFTADEARLKAVSFPSLTAREACDLYALGRWDDLQSGESLVQHDRVDDQSSVILRGVGDVVRHHSKVAELGEGQYLGGIDQNAERLEIDVVARTGLRVMSWPRPKLEKFLAARPDVALALQRSVGLELSRLLYTTLSEFDS